MVPKINSSFSWTLKCNFTFTKSFKINFTIWLHIFAITIPTGYVTSIDYHWLPRINNVKCFSNWSDSLLLPSFPLYHLAPHIKQWYCWYVILNKNFTFISAWWIFNWIKTSFSASVGRVFVNLQTNVTGFWATLIFVTVWKNKVPSCWVTYYPIFFARSIREISCPIPVIRCGSLSSKIYCLHDHSLGPNY